MKSVRISLFGMLALAAVVAACAGGKPIDVSDTATTNPTGTATPSKPTTATFDSKVNPFLTGHNCSQGGCHGTPGTGSSGTPYIVSATDSAGNYTQTVCNPRLKTYGTSPTGVFLTHFCTNATTPSAAHNGTTATAQNCTDFYNWAKEGSGAPPTCP